MTPLQAKQSTDMRLWWKAPSASLEGKTPMRHLFDRFHGIYMDRWLKSFPNTEAITNWTDAWSDAFTDESIAPAEIRIGIDQCRKLYDWPPTLPEFLKACRPTLDPEIAFSEAVTQMHKRRNPTQRNGELVSDDVWSHPAIYWAAVSLGGDLMTTSYPQIKNRWRAALDTAMKGCQEVPVFRQALPAPGKLAVSPEEGRRRIREMMSGIGMRMLGDAEREVIENDG